jgi:excisionase family DNA binding protein
MATQDQQNQTNQARTEIPRLTLDLWPDVGRALGLGRNSTFKAAKAGQIPAIRIGKRLLVPRAAFDALLNGASKQAPAA